MSSTTPSDKFSEKNELLQFFVTNVQKAKALFPTKDSNISQIFITTKVEKDLPLNKILEDSQLKKNALVVYLQISLLLMDTYGVDKCFKYLNYWDEINEIQAKKEQAIILEDYESCIIFRDRQKLLMEDIEKNLIVTEIDKNVRNIISQLESLFDTNHHSFFINKFFGDFGIELLKEIRSKIESYRLLDISIDLEQGFHLEQNAEDNWKSALGQLNVENILGIYRKFWLGIRICFDIRENSLNRFMADRLTIISYIFREIKKVGDISRSFFKERPEVCNRILKDEKMRNFFLCIPVLFEIAENLVRVFEVLIYSTKNKSNPRKIFAEFEVCKKIYTNDFLQFFEKIKKNENFESKGKINSHTVDTTDLINCIIEDISTISKAIDSNNPTSNASSMKSIVSHKNIKKAPNINTKVCSLCFGILVIDQKSNISKVCGNVYNSLIVNKE